MRLPQKARWTRLPAGLVWTLAWLGAVAAAAAAPSRGMGAAPAIAGGAAIVHTAPDAAGLLIETLAGLHPDYTRYIGALRPADPAPSRPVYMALVRAGATDPSHRASAPLAGQGARNDIVFDQTLNNGRRSRAWTLLLLDHEYFHARHLAGATTLPRPSSDLPEIQRHFYEAAAWGYNVGRARAGLYDGLRPEEFREALERYGDHYRALLALLGGGRAPAAGRGLDARALRAPEVLLTTLATPPPGGRGHPPGSGRSPAIP